MNTGGWIIMLASIGGVTLLFAWCIYRVLADPPNGDHSKGETPAGKEGHGKQPNA